jgi:hypothetical protein
MEINDTPSGPPPTDEKITPQQRYRQTEKCKAARNRYYESKGRDKAAEYYLANKEKILQRAKQRYIDLRNGSDAV